jgi:hypothetical protein
MLGSISSRDRFQPAVVGVALPPRYGRRASAVRGWWCRFATTGQSKRKIGGEKTADARWVRQVLDQMRARISAEIPTPAAKTTGAGMRPGL